MCQTTAPWTAFRVASHVASRLNKMRLFAPTPVQRVVLDALMPRSPSDVASRKPLQTTVIRWPTGAGKTLAYALPLLSRVDTGKSGRGLQALVVAPTRELSLQTLHTLKKLTGHGRANRKGHAVKVMSLMGRRTPRMEAELMNAPPDIAVGTPQTVATLLAAGLLPLADDKNARTLVLDEVGELVKHHRWVHVEQALRDARWTRGAMWMVSAHVPPGAAQKCISATGRSSPYSDVVVLEPETREHVPLSTRHVALTPPGPRLGPLLASMLARPRKLGADEGSTLDAQPATSPAAARAAAAAVKDAEAEARFGDLHASARKALVFVERGTDAEELKRNLKNKRISAAAIHSADGDEELGGDSEGHRGRGDALKKFAQGASPLRVIAATEMLAHGVDIRGATHVINAQVPTTASSYLHRAGRVGRTGGAPGTVVSLPRNPREMARLQGFAKELGFALEEVREAPRPEIDAGGAQIHVDNDTCERATAA